MPVTNVKTIRVLMDKYRERHDKRHHGEIGPQEIRLANALNKHLKTLGDKTIPATVPVMFKKGIFLEVTVGIKQVKKMALLPEHQAKAVALGYTVEDGKYQWPSPLIEGYTKIPTVKHISILSDKGRYNASSSWNKVVR